MAAKRYETGHESFGEVSSETHEKQGLAKNPYAEVEWAGMAFVFGGLNPDWQSSLDCA